MVKEDSDNNDNEKLTLAASHIFTVLSNEDVAKIVEFGWNRISVMRRECPSEVLSKSKVSMFQIRTCQQMMKSAANS